MLTILKSGVAGYTTCISGNMFMLAEDMPGYVNSNNLKKPAYILMESLKFIKLQVLDLI